MLDVTTELLTPFDAVGPDGADVYLVADGVDFPTDFNYKGYNYLTEVSVWSLDALVPGLYKLFLGNNDDGQSPGSTVGRSINRFTIYRAPA